MVSLQEWHKELSRRRRAFWEIAQRKECDLALIYGSREHPEAFRYLTNFVPVLGDMWGILKGDEQMTCLLNFHWQLKEARTYSGLEDWHGIFDPLPSLLDGLAEASPQRLAVFGMDRITFAAVEAIRKRFPGITLLETDGDFRVIRRRKSALEIELLRQAVHLTEKALCSIREELRPGMLETEVAARLNFLVFSEGADMAFPVTVMSGNEDDSIIRLPLGRRIQEGESVMIDIGAMYEGYQADVSRTFVIGEAGPRQRHAWETILRAYEAVLKLARPGTPCLVLHQTASQILEEAGYPLKHRIGHGVGLATSFEWPSLDSEISVLESGMTLAIEPGVYEFGVGAMKLEDVLLITEEGCEVLSDSARNLTVGA